MKKALSILLVLLLSLVSVDPNQPSATADLQLIAEAPIFGIGKPKYNKNRIDRQNSVNRKNRRTKRMNRKFGIGHHSSSAVENWAWMLPQINWEKGGMEV